MSKVASVANIIVNVGEMCGRLDLKEEDLPAGLLNSLRSLHRGLNRVERVLKECSKKKGFKRLFLRKDLLMKINRCNGDLSHELQVFLASMALDTRLESIAKTPKRREVSVDSGPIEPIS
ncbi:hypothetical protein EI94DRAFT_1703520 [Lactarius quietus]|nr:hypothetical protein EI94DRAFT_1703520 [Lactarius quietus]